MTAPSIRSVCLVTPGHVASTPRLVKEADALVEAGYRVHVIAGRHFTPIDALDADILSTAKWTHTRIDYRGGAGTGLRKLLRRFARRLAPTAPFATTAIAARAHQAETARFTAAAARTGADFYFGHCLAALPVVARAAKARGAKYGFDAEDFHDAETAEAVGDRTERMIRRTLHLGYLPGCAYRTAASPLIAQQYGETYGISPPKCVLNVFPLSYAPSAPLDPGPISEQRPARFYWFSQTIGAGRGLEAVVEILARMAVPAELHLRGHAEPEYRRRLQAHADAAGLRRRITFLPSGAAAEMVRLAAPFDLGLSTELTAPLNRDLCLTNKIFVYLLAGVPQFLSRTRAQTALAAELGDAALLGDLDRPGDCARRLDAFFASPAQIESARRNAWRVARERFCWDREKDKYLGGIREVLK